MKKKIIHPEYPTRHCSVSELAKASGVSPATVSRVFNNHPYVAPEIRQRVRDAACWLGYKPRLAADALHAAVMLDRMEESQMQSYLNKMLCVLAESCERHNVMLEIIGSNSRHLLNENFIRAAICLKRVLSPEALREAPNTHFVCMNFAYPGCASIMSDDAQGIELAFQYLRERGHRRIALVLPCNDPNGSGKRRFNSFASLVRTAQPGDPMDWTVFLDDAPVERVALLVRAQKPDAFLIAGEDMALQVNYALSLLNLRIPDDLSIVAYENFQASRYMTPPHTTVMQDFENLAERAVECVTEILSNKLNPESANVLLPNRLIERDSVRCRN